MTPSEFKSLMVRLRREIEEAAVVGVREAAEIIKEEAKALIGEEHPAIWEIRPETGSTLTQSTIDEKIRIGAPSPAPLLRTGELKDSIKVVVTGLHAEIGTDDPAAPYLEHGTHNMPPRPFLMTARMSKANEAMAAIERNIARAIKKIA